MSPAERIFTRADLAALPAFPDRNGIVVARDAGGSSVWIEFLPIPARALAVAASEVAALGDVAYVAHIAIHPLGCLTASTALAVAVAGQLRRSRREVGLDPSVVTAASRPDLGDVGDELVRVPHLIAVAPGDGGTITDAVVWEVMRADRYTAWLGGAQPPDHAQVEASIRGLLALRRLARCGQLDRLPDVGALRDLLGGGYLSARITYRHPDVVLPAAREAAVCFSEEG